VVYGRPESSKVLRGVLESGRFYSIPVQELAREAAARRWPCYAPPEGFHAAFEPGAGFLRAEACTLAHAAKARRLGADLREGETMLAFDAQGGGVRVRTNLRTYEAAKLVVAGGGWSSNLLRDLGLPLELRRMLLAWFRADPLHIQAPGFIFDLEDDFYYGFPSTDGATIKIAGHHDFETMQDPAEKDLIAPSADRVARLEGFLAHCLPLARPGLVRAAHCIYTMTPDEDFVIDLHPEHPKICFAAGFSGHGFKFASVVGEVLADLSEGGTTKHPIGFLRADRFSSR
jgi:sarcosine oxidase